MIKNLKTIDIDEIALKKGQGNFVTIITSHEETGKIRLLAVLLNRKKERLFKI